MHALRLAIGGWIVWLGQLPCNASLLTKGIDVTVFKAPICSQDLYVAVKAAFEPGKEVFELLGGLVFSLG
jgi:hypothetical protein